MVLLGRLQACLLMLRTLVSACHPTPACRQKPHQQVLLRCSRGHFFTRADASLDLTTTHAIFQQICRDSGQETSVSIQVFRYTVVLEQPAFKLGLLVEDSYCNSPTPQPRSAKPSYFSYCSCDLPRRSQLPHSVFVPKQRHVQPLPSFLSAVYFRNLGNKG